MDPLVRRTSSAALVGCLAVALTACGGGSPTADGAEETVEEYVEAYADGRGSSACDLLTEEYAEDLVDEWNDTGFGDEEEDCEDVVEAGAIFAEAFGADDLEIADFSTEVDGDEATVEVTYEDEEFESETYHLVFDDGDWLIDAQDEGGGLEDEATDVIEETEPTEDETTPMAAPLNVGETGTVGDWEVSITEVNVNATDLLSKPRYYNDRPAGQYVLVTFEATYAGDERSGDVEFDLSWSMTPADQQVLQQAEAVTTPADDQSWPTEARAGGTVTGQAVFDVDPGLLNGALVTVEAYADGDEEYVDFAL